MNTYRFFLASLFLLLSTFALLLTSFPSAGWPGGDGRDYANITEALVEGGSFDLRHASRPYRGPRDRAVIRMEDGRLYSVYPMGKALAQAPFLALARTLFADSRNEDQSGLADHLSFSFTEAFLYGLSGALLFVLLARVLEFSYGISLLGVGLYCVATLALPFSKIHGVETLQAVLFMGMVIAGLQPGRWSIATICLCFGWLVLTKPPSAVALPIFLYLFFHGRIWQRSQWPARILALAFTVGTAALFFYYNWLRSGDVGASYPASGPGNMTFSVFDIAETLQPLLFTPDRNLFINNPILILSLPGLFLLRHRPYLLTALGLWLTMLLFYGASGNKNWGAYVGNARYTMPFLFLLIPPALAFLCWLFSRLSALWTKWLAAAVLAVLLLISVYVQVLYSTFSEFHVKQFEYAYNVYARQYNMPEIDEAKRQLRFAHTLAWSTESCKRPAGLTNFSYPAADAKTSSFSAIVLKTQDQVWFCKDYLFLNIHWFSRVQWLATMRWTLLFLCLGSLLLTGIVFTRLPRQRLVPDRQAACN